MYQPYLITVSVKGIVFENKKVWLRKNERDEWELPGGKLDEGEQPEETLYRELQEELGFKVSVKDIIQAHLHTVERSSDEGHGVFVVSYLCEVMKKIGNFEFRGEAGKASFEKFSLEEVKRLSIPEFYKEAILKAFSLK